MSIYANSVRRPVVSVAVLGLVCCFLPAASASLMSTNFALFDGLGPDAGRWRGGVNISAGPTNGQQVDADVEWAAFAPGKFQLFLNAEHPGAVDPSGGAEVIYAYQVTSISTAIPGIYTLSVGVDPEASGDARGSVSPTFVPLTGGKPSSHGFDQSTSMLWLFLPPPAGTSSFLVPGDTSAILVFSSPNAPELDFIQLNSGLASPSPSPLVASISDRIFTNEIPEPASAALAALAVLGLFARRPPNR